MFEFDVQLNKQIYGKVAASIFAKKFLLAYVIIAVALIALVFDMILVSSNMGEWSGWLFPGVIVLYFVGFPIAQYFFGIGWTNSPTAGQLTHYVLTNDGLKADGATYHVFQAWSNFLGVRQLKLAVVLFFTQNQAFILPNSSFSNEDNRRQLVAFVRDRIPAANQRRLRLPNVRRVGFIIGLWVVIIVAVFVVLSLWKR